MTFKKLTTKQRGALSLADHHAYHLAQRAHDLAQPVAVTLERLDKASRALSNAIARGRRVNGSYDQIDRFEYLREILQATAEGETAWQGWCRAKGASPLHNAYDCFA